MTKEEQNHSQTPKEVGASTLRRRKHVAGNRANAQRAKLDAQAEARVQQQAQETEETTRKSNGKHEQRRLLAHRRANTTIAHAIDDYLQDHAMGNHSDKTLEWHRTALGLMQRYLEQERGITLVGEIDAPKREETVNQVGGAPGLPADAQVGFIVEALFLQVQPELAIRLALRAGDLLLFIGQRLANPLRDRVSFQRRSVSDELVCCAGIKAVAVVGMQVALVDGKQHLDALLTRYPIGPFISQHRGLSNHAEEVYFVNG